MNEIRILIVDSQAMFCDGLRAMLEHEDQIKLVGEAGDVDTAVRLACELQPDVILMELQLSDGNAIEAIRAIRARCSTGRIVLLTACQDDALTAQAIREGAVGCISKYSRFTELVEAVLTVVSGRAALDSVFAAHLFDQYRRLIRPSPSEGGPDFTEREIKILAGLTLGLSNRAIAEQLYLSEQTIKNHLSVIFQKLGVTNRTQAALVAIQHGIVSGKPSGV